MTDRREEFEQAMRAVPYRGMDLRRTETGYEDRDTDITWEGWQLGRPDGWKLVPVEPTAQMVIAGELFGHVPNIYAAMLRSAPQPSGESGQKEL